MALFAFLLSMVLGMLVDAVEERRGEEQLDAESELPQRHGGGYPKKPYAQNQAILQEPSHVTFVGNATRTSSAGLALFERAYSKCHMRFTVFTLFGALVVLLLVPSYPFVCDRGQVAKPHSLHAGLTCATASGNQFLCEKQCVRATSA